MVQSGRLNRRISLGVKKRVKDYQGFQTYDYVEIARPWASIRPVTEQSEINSDKESVMSERVTFEIYYRKDVTKNMYVIFDNKEYQITSIYNPGFENKYLELNGERDQSKGEAEDKAILEGVINRIQQ